MAISERHRMKLRLPHIPVWLKRTAAVLFVLLLAAAIVFLIYECMVILRQQPDDLFARVRAILLTLAIVVGLPFLVWRIWIADRQNQIKRESVYTELFGRAIESLGATRSDEDGTPVPVVESRVGAVFGLERLSKVSQNDYGTIVETLSTYIRDQCGQHSTFAFDGDDPDEEGISMQEKARRLEEWLEALHEWIGTLRQEPPADRADVAAALTVLSRRGEGRHWKMPSGQEEVVPRLTGANLQGADLRHVEELGSDSSMGGTHLEASVLDGTNLSGSSFIGSQAQAELTASELAGRSLVGVQILGGALKAEEPFPILDGATLDCPQMEGVTCSEPRFRGARLVRANLRNADLIGAKFGVANASHACFDGANLAEAEFLGALLEGSSFAGANLSDAIFQNAVLRDVKLEGALLMRTDFTRARCLEPEMLESAFGTADTLLPAGMTRPSHWTDESSAVERWKDFRAVNFH